MKKKILLFSAILLSVLSLTSCKSDKDCKKVLTDYIYEEVDYDKIFFEYNGKDTKLKLGEDEFITTNLFANNPNITKIVVNEKIPKYAFKNCTGLNEVKLNSPIVDDDAFVGCNNVTILKTAHKDAYAYRYFNNLSKIYSTSDIELTANKAKTYAYYNDVIYIGVNEIPTSDKFTTISRYAYYGRNALTSVNISATISKIEEFAFAYNKNVEFISVDSANTVYDSRDNSNAIIETSSNKLIYGCKNTTIPQDVLTISTNAFTNCDITSLIIPFGIKNIEQQAFVDCNSINTIFVDLNNPNYDSRDNSNAIIETKTNKLILASNQTTIPSTVTTIGSYAFSNSNVEEIVIPDTVNKIEDYAFAGMKNLKKITIPKSITKINTNIFDGCDNLETIVIADDNMVYSSPNSNTIVEKENNRLIYQTKTNKIPEGIKVIGRNVFSNSNIDSIVIPNSVQQIEDYAFYNCKNLTSITLSENLEKIGDYAFAECSNVVSLSIPDSVKTIGVAAFLNMNKIQMLKIPYQVNSIGLKAFGGFKSLISVTVDEKNDFYKTINNAELVEKANAKLILASKHTVLSSDITSIESFAYYGVDVSKIVIPASITTINDGAFAYCENITEFEVDSANPRYKALNNTIIDNTYNSLVAGCITSIVKEVSKINAYAFAGCNLLKIELPKSVTVIDEYAFADNYSLLNVRLNKKMDSVKNHAFKNTYLATFTANDFFGTSIKQDNYEENWNK